MKVSHNEAEIDFKYFAGIAHQTQPERSDWCWAACLSKLIEGFEVKTDLNSKQCAIVYHYLKNYKDDILTYLDICESDITKKEFYDSGLDTNEELENIFLDHGIKCTSIYKNDLKDKLGDFSFINETITNTLAPIIIKIKRGQAQHLMLISGFGHIKDCKYILVSDPLKGSEMYYDIDKFINENNILSAWICEFTRLKNASDSILIRDSVIMDNISKVDDFMTKVLTVNPSLNQYIESSGPMWKFTPEFFSNNFEESDSIFQKSKSEPMCSFMIPREGYIENLSSLIPIEFLNKFVDEKDRLLLNAPSLLYFGEYAITVEVRINEKTEKTEYKATLFPQNYNLNKTKWVESDQFEKELFENNEPIKYFNK